jgi:hypothetical protein
MPLMMDNIDLNSCGCWVAVIACDTNEDSAIHNCLHKRQYPQSFVFMIIGRLARQPVVDYTEPVWDP